MTLKAPIKGIFFDAGWTLFYNTTGNWFLPRKCDEYIDPQLFASIPEDRKNRAFDKAIQFLDDNHLLLSEEEEFRQSLEFYSMLFSEFPELHITERMIEEIARSKVYDMENYGFYEDTLPTLEALLGKYKLGIISDTFPSIHRILAHGGIDGFFEARTFSCDLGAFKPDPRMYEHALKQMGLPPEQTVFVDDSADNLEGAQKCGIQPVLITAKPNAESSDLFPSIKTLRELLDLLP